MLRRGLGLDEVPERWYTLYLREFYGTIFRKACNGLRKARGKGEKMSFFGAVITYGLILVCFVAVGALAIFTGIAMRKRKDKKLENENKE